jgi:hypothetical protein
LLLPLQSGHQQGARFLLFWGGDKRQDLTNEAKRLLKTKEIVLLRIAKATRSMKINSLILSSQEVIDKEAGYHRTALPRSSY